MNISPAQLYLMDAMPSVLFKGLVLALLALITIFQMPYSWKLSTGSRTVSAVFLIGYFIVLLIGLAGLLTI